MVDRVCVCILVCVVVVVVGHEKWLQMSLAHCGWGGQFVKIMVN